MQSRLGLYGLNFFTAAVQAGFGPFIAVWLTQNGWSLTALGLALSIGTLAALLGQLPGGMLVDQIYAKRPLAAGALIALGGSALLLCLAPTQPLVLGGADRTLAGELRDDAGDRRPDAVDVRS